jgi:sugar phosphate isomerase/epimerase
MDWAEITQALADIDYDGDLTYEVAPSLLNTTDDTFTALGAKFMADVGRHLINSIESKKKK